MYVCLCTCIDFTIYFLTLRKFYFFFYFFFGFFLKTIFSTHAHCINEWDTLPTNSHNELAIYRRWHHGLVVVISLQPHTSRGQNFAFAYPFWYWRQNVVTSSLATICMYEYVCSSEQLIVENTKIEMNSALNQTGCKSVEKFQVVWLLAWYFLRKIENNVCTEINCEIIIFE